MSKKMLKEKAILAHFNLILLVGLLNGCVPLVAGGSEDQIKYLEPSNKIIVDRISQVPAMGGFPPKADSRNFEPISSKASDRLMKDLSKVYKSDSYKKGLYTVELVEDNLYEWRVALSASLIDDDSHLYKQLVRSGGEKSVVELRFSFDGDYPFAPPFVRLVYPHIYGGYVEKAGVLCLELLSATVSF